jgi:hypothetical protein
MSLLVPVYWWYVLEVEMAPQEAMALCRESLATLTKPYKFQPSSDPSSEIIVETDWSWRSFGEFVWLKVSKIPPHWCASTCRRTPIFIVSDGIWALIAGTLKALFNSSNPELSRGRSLGSFVFGQRNIEMGKSDAFARGALTRC